MTSKSNNLELTMVLNSGITFLSTSVMKKGFHKKNSSPYTPEQNGVAEKNRTLIEAARTMLSESRHVLVVIEIHASSNKNSYADQNDHNDQNDHPVQDNEILNDDQSEPSNPKNDNHIIDNLPNTKYVQITEHLSSPTEDTSVPNAVSSIKTISPSFIPFMATSTTQDRWSRDKHIELVNIVGNPGDGMLTRVMVKELSAASSHECLFVDFLSEEEPK
ncbi:hypothetical protein Tco_1428451 [Tanacetum coccineum]